MLSPNKAAAKTDRTISERFFPSLLFYLKIFIQMHPIKNAHQAGLSTLYSTYFCRTAALSSKLRIGRSNGNSNFDQTLIFIWNTFISQKSDYQIISPKQELPESDDWVINVKMTYLAARTLFYMAPGQLHKTKTKCEIILILICIKNSARKYWVSDILHITTK